MSFNKEIRAANERDRGMAIGLTINKKFKA